MERNKYMTLYSLILCTKKHLFILNYKKKYI